MIRLTGVAAAPGMAIGPAWRHAEASGDAPVPDIRAAAARAAADLTALAARVRTAGRAEEAGIFEAQALMAEDPTLLEDAERRAIGQSEPDAVAAAVEAAARAAAETLAAVRDELLAARAADVRDVGGRIARIIAGRSIRLPDRPSIALADDLPPSVTAEIPEGLLLGIALERGSAVSHAAILARSLGIPAVVAVGGLVAAADAADASLQVGLDGGSGLVLIDPDDTDLTELRAAADRREAALRAARALRDRPGATADGHQIALLANIGRPEDARRALDAGAEGVGLFRTEFLYVGRSDAPSEDEQARAYRAVLDAFGERPVVIRLLDIGGDKPVPYMHLEPEANPFLGMRGLRLAESNRELQLTQIRAIARAGAGAASTPRVMAPMVATIEDVELLHGLIEEALADLDARAIARASRLEVGIMVEVPSAALMAAELARRVDFFSIGSNDLTQYVLAMDRTHPGFAAAADAIHPAVLRAIRETVRGANAAGIEVAVCGELAGDPLGAQVLVGLGVTELSMDAGRLDEVRAALAARTRAELAALADAGLNAETAPAVRALAATAAPSASGVSRRA
ncbi:MAG TPA: phosphoenolpyruvate--protein phosphotransferase [Candidatus Deferrimicrobiaceae bacterium]|nr:phosphoenolpyruvate--protein phosphotransferase [Candidatus Deferrimicrobiaceae bacterium]